MKRLELWCLIALLALLAVVAIPQRCHPAPALYFTTPEFGIDTLNIADPCNSIDTGAPQNIVWAELWRAACGTDGSFTLVRGKPTQTAYRDSFECDTTNCATYGVRTRNARDLWSCFAYHTVGIPPTTVDPPIGYEYDDDQIWYDVQGRVLADTTTTGMRFKRSIKRTIIK